VTLATTKMIDSLDFEPTPLFALDSAAEPVRRARSYLHANCAFCHRGGSGAELDLRVGTATAAMNLCRADRGARIASSMRSAGADRMPPVGRATPHIDAIAVVEDLLRSTCP
jgi:hypothetical protein